MRIAAFYGSPRPNGNTDTLTDVVLAGARENGCDVEAYYLRMLRVHPCTGCDSCGRSGRLCIFRDDGDLLYDAMARCDAYLFATPVYWYGPTTIMKGFLDRLVVFNKPHARPLVRGKSAILVAAWEEKGTRAVEPMVRLFELGFEYLELRFVARLLVDGLGPKNAARGNSDALERARALGRSVAPGLSSA
jgi:multimeric flavodoxin WrbA